MANQCLFSAWLLVGVGSTERDEPVKLTLLSRLDTTSSSLTATDQLVIPRTGLSRGAIHSCITASAQMLSG